MGGIAEMRGESILAVLIIHAYPPCDHIAHTSQLSPAIASMRKWAVKPERAQPRQHSRQDWDRVDVPLAVLFESLLVE